MRLSQLTRLTVMGWLALTLAPPLVGQGTGTTRDILVMNFATMAAGALPGSTGSLEVVDRNGSRMLRASGASSFRVSLPRGTVLPENFTLEFDLIPKECCTAEDLAFEGTLTADNSFAKVSWGRVNQVVTGGGSPFPATIPASLSATLPGQLTRVVATFEGGVLKMYTNAVRLYTLSDRRFPRGNLLLVSLSGDDEDKGAVYLTRLRVAEGVATPGVNAVVATSTGTGMLSAPATASGSQALTAGATAVTGLTVTLDSQGKATLKWVAVPDATAYAAMRWNVNDLTCCKNLSPSSTATQWDDGSLTDGTYGYRVYATTGSAIVVGETRVTVKNGTITEAIASAGSGSVASPSPSPPPPPPPPTLDPARSIDRTSFTSPPPPPPPPPPGTLDPARSITRTDFQDMPVLYPITGSLTQAKLTWTLPSWAQYTEVYRKVGTGNPELRTPDRIEGNAFTDKLEDSQLTYDYQVKAIQPFVKSTVSAWISFTPHPLTNPGSMSGRPSGDREATLAWQAVPGVTTYRVDGPGLPVTGQLVTGSVVQVKGLQPGTQTWQVASVFEGELADMSKRPSATVTIPSVWRSVPYLSMRNGTTNQVEQIAYYDGLIQSGMIKECRDINESKGFPWSCLDMLPNYTWNFNFPGPYEATFADMLSMGAGRHIYCKGAGPEVLCWASTHGPEPGASGWGDVTTALNAALGGQPNRGWTLIRLGYQGALFVAAGVGLTGAGYDVSDSYGFVKTSTVFDLEGPKNLPHSCLACHGGHYDPIAHKVIGASLIPLDPGVLVFSAGGGLTPDQEESVRQINQLVLYSNPSQAVKDYIRGLYGGTPEVAGTKANPNYTPPGWTQAPDLYRKVVKPYCQGCHLQQQNLHFASYQNFVDAKAAILTAVCTTRTMPHSEAGLLAFWRNGGTESLPDYLSGALGLGKCAP